MLSARSSGNSTRIRIQVGYGAYKLARYGAYKLVDFGADRIVSLLRSQFDLTELTGWYASAFRVLVNLTHSCSPAYRVEKSLSAAHEHLPPLVEHPLVPADALKGAEDW